MIKRVCPDCGNTWFSSAESVNWKCEACDKILTPMLNENPNKEKVLTKKYNDNKKVNRNE